MKVSLSKKRKVILCLILIFAVLLVGLYFFINWNNYFFDSVEVSKVSRPYSGQKSLVELQSAFADIPEIRSVIDNNQAVDNASS